ncbi:MAG: PEPxxWA-CTERM sorting domain-containing protein [Rhizobiales bacterium]|nr:PEPxxWA-CTERM sorting domain-containing protein [Hyphomicrobiales bacterium]
MKLFASLLCGAALCALAAPASALTVDVSALGPGGTTVNLAAGAYTVTYAASGLYQGWSPWGSNSGCDAAGGNCSTGYLNAFAIDFGFGTGMFNHVDGFQYGYVATPGNSGKYATPAQALAAYQTLPLSYAPLPTAADPAAYALVGGAVTFTLATAQAVNFFVLDYPYGDNSDGVSLNVTSSIASGVPEPSTWAMMLIGLAGLGVSSRRKARRAIAA